MLQAILKLIASSSSSSSKEDSTSRYQVNTLINHVQLEILHILKII